MKIYTKESQEYEQDLQYWCNSVGDIYDLMNDGTIWEEDLPDELKEPYECLTDEYGVYSYIAQYMGRNGFAFVAEYHEYNDEGTEKSPNNFERAVMVAKEIETQFPQYTVFIGKQMGFEGADLDDGTHDEATELVVFIDADIFSKEKVEELGDFFDKNAYA
jgi:hypothetical protein